MDKNTADFCSSSKNVGSYKSLILNLSGYCCSTGEEVELIPAAGILADYYDA